ncbi:hypothetical protein KIW84_024745 [Lathyrus oleraceus]|uniref:E3 ubiquitin-protein ligase RMA n=1 Tax=Pisum sativum TaxID=3888 RepID=A0A9D4YIN4_PEA|nr:hypothetical protein KIW84_024745 [Pisum sativum]
MVPLYGKGRSVTDPRTEIPPRPSDIHTLFASLEQTHLSREATEQRFKEYIDQCIEEFCVAQEQRIALLQEAQERQQRIKECRAEAAQRIRKCRAEYRADAEQRIKKLRADAEQRINVFRVECRVETEQRIKECRVETEQRIKECRVEYGAAAGQRINEFRADPVITLCGHLFCWPCLHKWLHHRSHPQECPVCKGVVGEEKLVPLYGKGRSVIDPRTKIPPRPSDIHTLFGSLEQMCLSREATQQCFKEYIDQCIEEFCVAQEQRIALLHEAQERHFQQLECRIKECRADAYYRIKKFCAEAEQRIKECRAEAYQLIRECRAEYRADAEQCIKKLRADAEQRISKFRAEFRVETEQRTKECRAETKQRIKECRVEYGAAAGQRIKECREEAEQRINEGVVGEEKLVLLYGKGRSVTDPRTEIPPRPSDIHTLFASLEQTRLSREATEHRFKEYIDQCIEKFCVAQEQRIALLQEAQERRFQQLECRIKECRADADYRIKKFRAEAEQCIKECRAEADQRIRECRAEYRADAEQRIKKLRADAEQRINEFRAECPVETEQRIKECRAETKQRIKECRVEYGAAAGQRIKECREEAERRRSVADPRTEIPPRPSDIHTLFASLEQTRLSREATEQRFKEYIDQCIEEFCVAQEQHYRIKKFRAEAEQRIKECRAEAAQRIRECRPEYRADAEQRIKKLRADAEQRIKKFRVDAEAAYQRVSRGLGGTMRSATAPNPSCSSGNRFNDDACDFECVVGEEKLVPLYGKGRSVTDPRTKIPPLPSDIHTLFGSLEQMRLSREATQQCFKEYIDQCIEEFCVAQEQRIVLLHEAQERHFQQLECRIKECRADAYYRIKKFCAEAEQRIKECRAEAYQLIRECRAEYRADAEQCIKKLRADAEQRISKFRAEFRVETEQRTKECRAETKQRIKECRVEYGAAAGQRIKECREEAEQRINEFRAAWVEQ